MLDEELVLRQEVAGRYAHLLGEAGIDTVPWIEPHNISAWAQYTIRVSGRDAVQERLSKAEIPTAVHYPIQLNKQPAVAQPDAKLPVGDALSAQVISLPMHPGLSLVDQQRVANALRSA